MSKINKPKFLIDLIEEKVNYKLTKPDDPSFLKTSEKISWIRWNENGTVKELSPNIELETSLVLNPHFGNAYTWLTTTIKEIVENTNDYIIFRTENSLYKLENVSSLEIDSSDFE